MVTCVNIAASMSYLRRISLIGVIGVGLVAGCANLPPLPPVAEPPTPLVPRTQPLDGAVGEVISVNTRLRFVVLDYSLNALPEIGDRLLLTRDGASVGELRATGPIRNNTIAADILSGEPQLGDQARPDRQPAPPP
jgi:hypothetical protein